MTEPKSDLLSFAKSVLNDEAAAIAKLAGELTGTIEAAVERFSARPAASRILVTGMGKAGFIAMKISATLSSLGFPSFYLHPADAIHGDLGRFTSQDLVLIFSKSGETPEVVRLLPIIKKIGSSIIAVTASSRSTLGSAAEIVIELGEIREVGSLGLAPTTSTTVMLAVGDALAMCLATQKNVTPEEFALYHPGGELGRQLLTVAEIMRIGEANCVVTDDTLVSVVLHQISSTVGRPGAAAVVDRTGKLVGVFTDGNLRRCIETGTQFLNEPIARVMSGSPRTVRPGDLATEAARVLKEFRIDQVIVADEKNVPVGLIDVQDLLARGIR